MSKIIAKGTGYGLLLLIAYLLLVMGVVNELIVLSLLANIGILALFLGNICEYEWVSFHTSCMCACLLVPIMLLMSYFDMSWFWGKDPICTPYVFCLPVAAVYMYMLYALKELFVVAKNFLSKKPQDLRQKVYKQSLPLVISLLFFVVCFLLIKGHAFI